MASTTTTLPRYRGLCGAIVTIREHTTRYAYDSESEFGSERYGHAWECECGVSGSSVEMMPHDRPRTLQRVREAANEHAAQCRALPPTATK
ncbi:MULTISPECIES: hypothetical protein [Actinomadura]|uniref:Uncharacterized protein n=1 Tax=Actinomadura miaoliensis TaxID=430685 RepID=A0ABP7WWJ7_9ACTN